MILFGLTLGFAAPAAAVQITDKLEIITLPSVGTAWQDLKFQNTYSVAPIVACTGTVDSYTSTTNPPNAPVVRLKDLGTSGTQIRVQEFNATDTAGLSVGNPVTCIVAAVGQHDVIDSVTGATVLRFEAGREVTRDNVQNFKTQFMRPVLTNLRGDLAVIGQVLTSNSSEPSAFHSSDASAAGCLGRSQTPDLGNGRFCIDNQNSLLAGNRASETVGYIVFTKGSGNFTTAFGDFTWAGDVSLGVIRGVANQANGYATTAAVSLDYAVATQTGENGGDGSFYTYVGSPPNGTTSWRGALEESFRADRQHTNEDVAYLGFGIRKVVLAINKAVDITSTDKPDLLTYTITLTNSGNNSATGVVVTDTLTQNGTTLTLNSGPTLQPVDTTAGTGDTNGNGQLEPTETWIYEATYQLVTANFDDGSDIANTASVDSNQSDPVTSTVATTALTQRHDVTMEKTHVLKVDANNNGIADLGDVITYSFRVLNIGNTTLIDLAVTDVHNGFGTPPVPGNETLTTDAAPLGDSVDTNTASGVWGNLKPGDTVTFTANYTVVQSDLDNLSIYSGP